MDNDFVQWLQHNHNHLASVQVSTVDLSKVVSMASNCGCHLTPPLETLTNTSQKTTLLLYCKALLQDTIAGG